MSGNSRVDGLIDKPTAELVWEQGGNWTIVLHHTLKQSLSTTCSILSGASHLHNRVIAAQEEAVWGLLGLISHSSAGCQVLIQVRLQYAGGLLSSPMAISSTPH